MKQVWMFLTILAMVLVSVPDKAWAQTGLTPVETYRVQRFGPDSVINSSSWSNVRGITTIRTGLADWYVFFATGGPVAPAALWRYDSRTKNWKSIGHADGLRIWAWGARAITTVSRNRVLVSGYGGTFASDDFGESWRQVLLPDSVAPHVFAKANGDTVYAGGYGVFRSVDNGETWIQLLPEEATYPHVTSLAVIPNSGTVLVGYGTEYSGSKKGGILKSTDRGQSWFHADAGLDSLAGGKNIQRLVAVGGFSEMVFAMTDGDGIYRSYYGGEDWKKLSSFPVPRFGDQLGLGITPLGLFAGYDDGYGCRKLYRSIDYGEHWTELTGFDDNLPMQFGYSIVKPNELIVGTDDFGYLFIFNNPTPVEKESILKEYALSQNFPNPFNPSTTIEFQLPERSFVKLTIHNLIGQEVAVLVNEVKETGYHRVEWNASSYPSGVYLYYLRAGNFVQTKRALLVKERNKGRYAAA